jgi:MarR family transcriptional regulator, organic hydroperoxide resistance regulator
MPRHADRHRRISLLFDLFAVSNRVRALLRQAMGNAGLRPDEYAIYSAVFKVGPLTISELAAVVGMPLTTVSDYVQTMTSRGHARRWGNPIDSRSLLVALTDEGLAAHATARVSFAKVISRLRRALPLPEQEVIRALHALDDAAGQVLAELAAEDRRQRQLATAAARVRTRPGNAAHD